MVLRGAEHFISSQPPQRCLKGRVGASDGREVGGVHRVTFGRAIGRARGGIDASLHIIQGGLRSFSSARAERGGVRALRRDGVQRSACGILNLRRTLAEKPIEISVASRRVLNDAHQVCCLRGGVRDLLDGLRSRQRHAERGGALLQRLCGRNSAGVTPVVALTMARSAAPCRARARPVPTLPAAADHAGNRSLWPLSNCPAPSDMIAGMRKSPTTRDATVRPAPIGAHRGHLPNRIGIHGPPWSAACETAR